MTYSLTVSDRQGVLATETHDTIRAVVECFRRLLSAHLNTDFTQVHVEGATKPWNYGLGNSDRLLAEPGGLDAEVEEIARSLHAFLHWDAEYCGRSSDW